MASEGPNFTGTGADDASTGDQVWSDPTNITASNDSRATANLNPNDAEESHYLKATNFGFSIPAGSTINGIQVEFEKGADATVSIHDSKVRIVKGGTIGSTDKADGATTWPDTDAFASHGGSSDLWGETWTVSDINASDFGVVISALNEHATIPREARIDSVRITVTYTEGGTGNVLNTVSKFWG